MCGTLSDGRTDLPFTIAADHAGAVILASKSHETHDRFLLSQIRDSLNLEGQVSIFVLSRNWSPSYTPSYWVHFSVASYDSQGYGGGIRTPLHHVLCCCISMCCRRKVFTVQWPSSGRVHSFYNAGFQP
jgi:hypothetical protein